MTWICLTVLIFSALSIYFSYEEYRKNKYPKKIAAMLYTMEGILMAGTAVLLILSL